MSWERWAARFARSVERRVDEAKGRLRPRAARRIQAYRGFGDASEVFVKGRILADPDIPPADAGAAWWRNLAASFRHLESDEVPGARLVIDFAGTTRHAVTDEEGFYRAWIAPARPPDPADLWHDVAIEVLDPIRPDAGRVRATGRVILPSPAATFGVISDLDDTVIRTDATRLIPMLRRTLLENARTRLPFAGVADFYAALHRGGPDAPSNPLFYVSSSPWNLYPVLTAFLEHNDIPEGPLMLRDWGITETALLPRGHGEHKLGAIRQIMDRYPALPFILIGDSGQEDPEIYRDIVHRYPERIAAVYIRNVTADPARARAIGELAEEVRDAGSELLLSDDTLAAARHAAERGWIDQAAVRNIERAISSS